MSTCSTLQTQSALTAGHAAQLEDEGYTVLRGFLDRANSARLRQHADSLLPAIGTKPGSVNDLRHPIPGSIMAEALFDTGILSLGEALLDSKEIRMLEQVLIRTDPAAPGTKPGATAWHVDMAFHPDEFQARPRRTYYHHVHSLSTVEPGGGAFMIVPGSHRQTYAASRSLRTDEELQRLHKDPISMAHIDVAAAIEVCPEEGDLLIFNPMCLHSASWNTRATPRYVYFVSFMDAGAEYLQRYLQTKYGKRALSNELAAQIAARRPRLYDW
jgi:ectoine hydroxylase-related dioxygenase (phytanoyl-CoA dioxygenase family)